MFLELVATFFFQGAREIHFKESRLRYLATRGGMALAVRRCVT